jgi:hypothetical protein
MTINEAIKILKNQVVMPRVGMHSTKKEAIKLGIEALKRFQEIRRHPGFSYNSILPGETE